MGRVACPLFTRPIALTKRGRNERKVQNAMAFQKLIDGAKAITLFRATGANDFTVSQWYTKLNYDTADMTNLGQAILGAFETHLMPDLGATVELVSCVVYDQRTVGAPKVTVTPIAPVFGGVATALAPLNAACVVTLRTNSRGRSARGRNYITGFAETYVGDTSFISTAYQAVETTYANLRVDTLAQGWQQVIASFQQDGVPLDPGVAREVTSSEVRKAAAGSQRRRIRRG